MSAVQVLNADLMPLHKVSLNHAVRLLCRGKAEIHEADPSKTYGPFPFPKVLRLIKYVVAKWLYTSVQRWSKAGVLRRDDKKCGYCGEEATTIDHVIPRSKGGGNKWTNTIAACKPCNQRKGNRTPEEAKMALLVKPRIPKRV